MPNTVIHLFSDSSSGISALGINGGAIIIQLITFLIVFWVLKRFAFKPILRVLEERRKIIDNGVKLGEEIQKEKAELEQKVSDQLSKARNEADNILSTAEKQARQLIQDTETNARDKSEKIIADADAQIKQDMAKAKKDLEKDLVGLIADTTEAIIQEKLDTKKDAGLIDRLLRSRRPA